MHLKLVMYGIARDIIGAAETSIDVDHPTNIGALKSTLVKKYPDFAKLTRFSMAVNEEYQDECFELSHGDEVVIIPPVSGG